MPLTPPPTLRAAPAPMQGPPLDAAALRHRVIAQNVANVNTPGYRRREVAFESDLAKALASPGATAHVKPQVVVSDGPERVDGNTVDMDVERAQFAENAVRYEANLMFLNSQLKSLLAAIQG